MRYRPFGNTGLDISEVSLGAWQIGGAVRGHFDSLGWISHGWGHIEEDDAVRLIATCGDLGINFIDTAAGYGAGRSEEIVGKAVSSRRDRWVIETKGGEGWTEDLHNQKDFSHDALMRQIDESLGRLGFDYVDVYLLHGPSQDDVRKGECLEALQRMKELGKARFVGASIGSDEMGLELIRSNAVDVLQVPMSITQPKMSERLLPAAAEAGVGIVVRGAFGAGFYTGTIDETTEFATDDRRSQQSAESKRSRAQVAERFQFLKTPQRTLAQSFLKYLLSFEGVSTVIPGSKDPKHMAENARTSEAPDLTAQEHEQIRNVQSSAN